ncbi:hypothetical protein BC834DRAFT_1035606 [Gloeopeniophorella convolvens]|nr:hypothetical protein BC834DRAFT_1035606 [Gloeopeniophorella convolvens]
MYRPMRGSRQSSPDDTIHLNETLLSTFPRSHVARPHVLVRLGYGKFFRYEITHDKQDLDEASLHFAEALLLRYRPLCGEYFNYIDAFYRLACALSLRFSCLQDPDDIEHSIKYFRFLLGLPHLEMSGVKRFSVLSLLAAGLTTRIGRGEGTDLKNLEEALSLYDQCFAMDPLGDQTIRLLHLLASSAVHALSSYPPASPHSKFRESTVQRVRTMLDIQAPRQLPELRLTLADPHGPPSCAGANDEAATQYDLALAHLPRHHPAHFRSNILMSADAYVRFGHSAQPEVLEEAIARARVALEHAHSPDERRDSLTVLSTLLKNRFERFGRAECMEEAHATHNTKDAHLSISRAVPTRTEGLQDTRGDDMSISHNYTVSNKRSKRNQNALQGMRARARLSAYETMRARAEAPGLV